MQDPKVKNPILVTGATGKQGGAVAHHLLNQGFQVRALTRDPQKPQAQALAQQGAEVVSGDLEDRASVEKMLEGTYGVFSVQSYQEGHPEQEIRQGVTLADAAKSAGVKHFVYSSVGSAERHTEIPHFDSKWQIEEHIRGIGLPHTILRPVFLMENWERQRNSILQGKLLQPLDPDKKLQQVSVDDIGAFAAMAFGQPEQWLGRAIEIAGDELTMVQLAQTFSHVIGQEVSYVQQSWEQFHQAAGEEQTIMYKWFNNVGYAADIPALRQEYPQLTSIETYLRRHGWEQARQ